MNGHAVAAGAGLVAGAALVDSPANGWGPPTTDPAVTGPMPATPHAAAPPVNPTMAVAVVAPPGRPSEPEAAPPTSSRQWGKYLPWIVAIIVVIVIVSVIRLTSSKSPGSLSPTTVTTTTAAAAGATGTTAPNAAGTDSATKTAYVTASDQIDVANTAAAKGLSGGASTSVPHVANVMAQYQKALQTFVFSIHGLHWTGATQASSQQLTLEIQSMVTYQSTYSSVNQANLQEWLDKFHTLSQDIETADNTVRGQLGIPTTKSYP